MGLDLSGRLALWKRHRDGVSQRQTASGAGDRTIHRHGTLADEACRLRPRNGELVSKKTVEPFGRLHRHMDGAGIGHL